MYLIPVFYSLQITAEHVVPCRIIINEFPHHHRVLRITAKSVKLFLFDTMLHSPLHTLVDYYPNPTIPNILLLLYL